MAVVDELVTILGVKLASDALSKLGQFKKEVEGIAKGVAALGTVALGVTAAAGAFINSVAKEAAELDALSQKTGISTDALQEWQYAARKSGVDAKAVTNDLVNLQKTMASPIPGQFNSNLMMLGVSVRDASGKFKTTDKVLEDLAGRFKTMSQARATQWASKLGISDSTLTLLRQGKDGIEALRKEAQALGGIIPNDAIKTATRFKQSLAELQFAVRGITHQVALATLPVLTRVVDIFKDWISINREWIALGLGAIADGIMMAFERLWNILKDIGSGFSPIIDAIKEFIPEMEAAEWVAHLVTGALVGLAVVLSPLLIKLALIGVAVTAAAILFEDLFLGITKGEGITGQLFNSFKERWPELWDALQKTGEFLKDVFIATLGVAWEAIKKVGEALGEIAGVFLDMVNDLAGPVGEFFGSFQERFPAITEAAGLLADFLGGVLVTAFEHVVNVAKTLIEWLGKLLEWLGGPIVAAFEKVEGWLAKLGFGKTKKAKLETEVTYKEGSRTNLDAPQLEYDGVPQPPGTAFDGVPQPPVITDPSQGPDVSNINVETEASKEAAEALNSLASKFDANTASSKEAVEALKKLSSASSAQQSIVQTAQGTSTPAIGKTSVYNDNKTVTVQVSTNDPVQAAEQTVNVINSESNINTPGQYAPTAS